MNEKCKGAGITEEMHVDVGKTLIESAVPSGQLPGAPMVEVSKHRKGTTNTDEVRREC